MSDDAAMRVALTFDAEHPDRPGCPPGNDERILDALRSAGVRATFFIQGRWAQANPDAAKRIADDGHLIGHHTHFHAPMPLLLGPDGIESDMALGQEAIVRATGRDPRPWFRCAFGTGHDDPAVLERLAALGYRNVHWHLEVGDWEPSRTGDEIAEDAVAGAKAHGDGVVVLLHTWPAGTGDAIEPMLRALGDLGATFVAVDELELLP